MTAPRLETVPILCPRCRTEVATVTDGPGLFVLELGEATVPLRAGDNSAVCPACAVRIYWRVLLRGAA